MLSFDDLSINNFFFDSFFIFRFFSIWLLSFNHIVFAIVFFPTFFCYVLFVCGLFDVVFFQSQNTTTNTPILVCLYETSWFNPLCLFTFDFFLWFAVFFSSKKFYTHIECCVISCFVRAASDWISTYGVCKFVIFFSFPMQCLCFSKFFFVSN